jgi:hypothetical protein
LLRVIFDLHELRRHLPTARLRIDPWPGRSRSRSPVPGTSPVRTGRHAFPKRS